MLSNTPSDRSQVPGEGTGSHVRDLIVEIQRDVKLLAEELQRPIAAVGHATNTPKAPAETSETVQEMAQENEDMATAIEELNQAAAEITVALDASRKS
jgi:methyl-accepting chemotaxis protein